MPKFKGKTQLLCIEIWQELFNLYRQDGGSLDRMFDMMCDYRMLQREVKKRTPYFFWGDVDSLGFTMMCPSKDGKDYFYEEKVYKITVNYNLHEFIIEPHDEP